jgi:type VII secretion protein EccB
MMASRRDLIHGYQFAARRVVSAVVMRQTDPTEWPFRRLGGAGFGTIMVAVIALAAVGIYGMIVPGGKTSWKSGGTVIVVKESGASYVYLKGELHPTLNFTSAVLLAGSTTITSTSGASLAGYKRGVELGIAGAPATLPTNSDLVAPPWSLCTQQTPNSNGTEVSRTRLVVSRSPNQGSRPGDQALLVTDMGTPEHPAQGDQYLIWHDLRYKLTDPNDDRVALKLDNDVDVPVGSAWLQALPSGADIGAQTVPGAGSASHAVPGASVTAGQVLKVETQDKGTVYYLAGTDTLIPISPLQADIQTAASNQTVQELSPNDAANAKKEAPEATTREQAPTTVPSFVRPQDSTSTVLCAAYSNNSFSPRILVDSAIPAGGGLPTEQTTSSKVPLADRVWVPPGKAALVESLESPKSSDGPVYLVTDEGRRYPVPSDDVLSMLGLSKSKASKLPASLLERIPEGPALDPDTAQAALAQEQADN